MRVLVIAHGYPPSAQAGAEVYARAHARALHTQGHEVVVLAREHAPSTPELDVRSTDDEGVRVVWINNTFRGVRTFADTYHNEAIGRLAERVIDEVRPHVAHIHHLSGLSTSIVHALAARRIPRVMTLHDYWLICHRGQLLNPDDQVCAGPEACSPPGCRACVGLAGGTSRAGFAGARALRAAERWLPRTMGGLRGLAMHIGGALSDDDRAARAAADRLDHMRGVCRAMTHFLAPSRFMRDRFVQFGVDPDRITWSPYGFDRSPFEGLARTTSHRLRIGFLGSLMVSKAPHLLLEAFARLRAGAASVDLVGPTAPYHGDDRYAARLTPLLGLEGVRTHGLVPHERVPALLAAMDVLVVPSIWPENSPLVIQEAFMAGVPVIASRIGGIPETVDDDVTGLLVEPGDVVGLARALTRCLDEPGLLPRLRSAISPARDITDDVRVATAIYRANGRRDAPRTAHVAAVVLNYRTPDDTLLATRSILASNEPPRDVFVVNNDDTPDEALNRLLDGVTPSVACFETGRNLGFPGGMNVGIREALKRQADFVLIANSDVIVPPDCIERLRAALDQTPSVGIAGPAVLSRSDPSRIESLGLSFVPRTGRMRVQAAGLRADRNTRTATCAVDAVSGCLMLIRREVFEAIGLFDDDYFFGFEDLDFCLRARQAGFSTVVAGSAAAYHEGGRSIGATSPRRLYFAVRNHLRLAERIQPSPTSAAGTVRAWAIVTMNLAHAVRPGGGHVFSRIAAVIRGTRDHRERRYGPDVAETI